MKKSLRALVAAIMAAVLIVCVFAGCSNTNSNTSKSSGSKKYKIGILQTVQHEALDAATKGFKEEVIAELGEDNVEFDEQNAAGDTATCATIANGFVQSNYDLIMANATPALQAAQQATTTIPIVGTSVTDYASALNIDSSKWTGKTGTNITGTSDLAPLTQQATMVKEIAPNAKTVGILYCSAEANSKYQADEMTKELKKLGFSTKIYTCADTNDIANVTTKAVDEVDALYIPTDNTIASSTETVKNIVEPKKIPVVCGEEGICRGCGIATLSISYEELGKQTGKLAVDILKNGTNPGDVDIVYAENVTKEYVKSRADSMGITIPSDYKALSEDADK